MIAQNSRPDISGLAPAGVRMTIRDPRRDRPGRGYGAAMGRGAVLCGGGMTDWRDDPEIVALRDALVRAICPGELTEEESIRARMAVLTDPARFIKTSGL